MFDAFGVYEGGVKLRTDLDVKAFKVLSETDVAGTQANLRQPDSTHFRRWEVAGSSHQDFHARQGLNPLQVRDLGGSSPPTCAQPPFSRIPFYFVGNAALDALVAWVRDGIEPAAGPDIVTPSVAPTSAEIARDSSGNALGGIRLSQHEVPTAANTGVNSGSGFCSLYRFVSGLRRQDACRPVSQSRHVRQPRDAGDAGQRAAGLHRAGRRRGDHSGSRAVFCRQTVGKPVAYLRDRRKAQLLRWIRTPP